jgi:cysteine synthase
MNVMSGPQSAAHAVREPAAGSVPRGGGTILDAIGNTPLIMVDGIWAKLEYLNPSGSIKARIAKYMIERAEREGLLRPGDTIVEASSGNTGNAMSMVAAVKGYRMLVVMPRGMSAERLAISRAFGAEVMTLGDFHVNDALAKVAELGRQPGYFAPQQFDSEWNVEENRTWLGPETLAQLPDGAVPDAVVGGVGTGGTIVGVGQCFRERNRSCRVVAVEPNESCILMCGEVGRHLIEGIADGFVPGIFARHRNLIDEIVAVDSEKAITEMRRLAREFGLFVGPSSGAHLVAARELRARYPDLQHVVTFFADEGEKYINDYFLGHDQAREAGIPEPAAAVPETAD